MNLRKFKKQIRRYLLITISLLYLPIIFSDWLHAKAKRVVRLYTSIVLLRACCAPSVIESASSKIMILCLPSGNPTFVCANVFILLRTTSIPLKLNFIHKISNVSLLPSAKLELLYHSKNLLVFHRYGPRNQIYLTGKSHVHYYPLTPTNARIFQSLNQFSTILLRNKSAEIYKLFAILLKVLFYNNHS